MNGDIDEMDEGIGSVCEKMDIKNGSTDWDRTSDLGLMSPTL